MAERTGCPILLSLWSYVSGGLLVYYLYLTNEKCGYQAPKNALPPYTSFDTSTLGPVRLEFLTNIGFSNQVVEYLGKLTDQGANYRLIQLFVLAQIQILVSQLIYLIYYIKALFLALSNIYSVQYLLLQLLTFQY